MDQNEQRADAEIPAHVLAAIEHLLEVYADALKDSTETFGRDDIHALMRDVKVLLTGYRAAIDRIAALTNEGGTQ